jgi:hypothetical protein
MTVPTRAGVLQHLVYPRSPGGLRGVAFHGLLGWGLGDPEPLVAAADLVVAVDVMTRAELLVFGEPATFRAEFLGPPVVLVALVVELDLDSDEIDTLATLVELVKGDHDLPWEVA